MPGAVRMKVSGLRQLDAALGDLAAEYGKASGKAVLRRVADDALKPMAEVASGLAPDDPETGAHDLKASITVGGKLTARQAKIARKDQNKATVTRYMGTSDPAGVPQEFGTVNHGPQPFMRPAFRQEARATIDRVAKGLGPEINKTATRLAKRRAARAAKAGG